jgi:hypothetical protein
VNRPHFSFLSALETRENGFFFYQKARGPFGTPRAPKKRHPVEPPKNKTNTKRPKKRKEKQKSKKKIK